MKSKTPPGPAAAKRLSQGPIIGLPGEEDPCLDAIQLSRLEQSFRHWAGEPLRPERRLSRQRILLIFLLIRYTGAKLSEVLALDAPRDIDHDQHAVTFRHAGGGVNRPSRQVQVSAALAAELRTALSDSVFTSLQGLVLGVDPGFVRRKFYERAEACGFPKRLGAPEMIRKSRAVELIRGNMPLPAVQVLLGHSTPNLTTSRVSFSADEIKEVTRLFMERESNRKTSARNSFFGKISAVEQGDIQARVTLDTPGGHRLFAMITNDSLARLGLVKGKLITAEVKAPWVTLQRSEREPESSAENRFRGLLTRITRGEVATEYIVRIADGTELCAIVSSESGRLLGLQEQDPVWVLFNCYSVVLHID